MPRKKGGVIHSYMEYDAASNNTKCLVEGCTEKPMKVRNLCKLLCLLTLSLVIISLFCRSPSHSSEWQRRSRTLLNKVAMIARERVKKI